MLGVRQTIMGLWGRTRSRWRGSDWFIYSLNSSTRREFSELFQAIRFLHRSYRSIWPRERSHAYNSRRRNAAVFEWLKSRSSQRTNREQRFRSYVDLRRFELNPEPSSICTWTVSLQSTAQSEACLWSEGEEFTRLFAFLLNMFNQEENNYSTQIRLVSSF